MFRYDYVQDFGLDSMGDIKGSTQSFQIGRGETLENGVAMVSNQPGAVVPNIDDQIAATWL